MAVDDPKRAAESKVALDKDYRPIGRVQNVDEDGEQTLRIRISPHREFRQKFPECTADTLEIEVEEITKRWGHNVVLDKDVKELIRISKQS